MPLKLYLRNLLPHKRKRVFPLFRQKQTQGIQSLFCDLLQNIALLLSLLFARRLMRRFYPLNKVFFRSAMLIL